jgi:transcriptional regulator with XRE-family HTH domain
MGPGGSEGFGPLLRRIRHAAGLIQEDLAAAAGLSVRVLSDLERGIRRPCRGTTGVLAEALRVGRVAPSTVTAHGRAPAGTR